MTRSPTFRGSPAQISCATLAIALAVPTLTGPARANPGAQIEIHGHVAPRCWVANPTSLQSHTERRVTGLRAVCNQATPMIQSSVRALDADGILGRAIEPTVSGAQIDGRAAMEITISPHL